MPARGSALGHFLNSDLSSANKGTLAATLRKMSDDTAYQLIERIMEFTRKLRGLVVTRRVFVDPMSNEGRSSVH